MLIPIFYVTIALVLYLYWLYLSKSTKKKLILQPPDLPKKLPIIGHAHLFAVDSERGWKFIEWMSMETLKQGGILSVSFGPKTAYTLTDPDDVLIASNACLHKEYYYGFAKNWLGDGFTCGPLQSWKKHRKMLSSVFSQKLLDEFVEVFNYQGRRLVAQWVDKRIPFIPSKDISLNSLESICQNAIGIRVENDRIINEDYEEALEDIFCVLSERFKKIWLHSDFIYELTSLKKREEQNIQILRKMTATALEKRQKLSENEINNKNRPKSFLDVIIELAKNNSEYTDEDLKEEVDNFIFSGHDTISAVLTYCMMTLGSYPEVQEKVYQEILEVMGDKDRDVEKDDYFKLKYTEAMIKETMRMYPIVPVIARKVTTDVRLKNYTMKAGTSCYMLLYGVLRHPLWGPDVNEFKPERWLSPDTLPQNPNVNVGFSLGRRICVGRNYAMISIKTSIVHLIRHYKISSNINNMVLKLDAVLKPVRGHEICLEKRVVS